MRKIKSIFTIIFTAVILITSIVPANAAFEEIFTAKKDEYATPVENQGSEGDCLYYSILSAAGVFTRKYFALSDTESNFSESNLKARVGLNYDIHNFGEILYKSVGCDIGGGYFITSVEMLAGRGRRYIQQKIKENGAVIAAIAMPEDGKMTNENYYNSETGSFFCPEDNLSKEKYHAITIVGWDENYDWSNFTTEPDSMGAWLCKNSYGEEYGDNGYFYLSYDYNLVYAASLEVSHMSGLSFVYPANKGFKYIGFVNGVSVRAFENNVTDNITVTVGEKTAFSGNVNLKNGYTLIKFDKPVAAGEIKVSGSKISTGKDTVYGYWSFLPKKVPMDIKVIDKDASWLETVERISVDINPKYYYACDTYGDNFHNMTYSAIDNCLYITPCDGYRFDESETYVDSIDGFYGFREGTIAQITERFPNTIRYDDGDDGRGRLIITGHSIGGAYATGINIVTDEEGLPSFAILSYDNGSAKTVSKDELDFKLYSDSEYQNKITSIEGLSEYYLKVGNLPQYITEDFSISINGEETDAVLTEEIEIKIKITIPDIEMSIKDFFRRLTDIGIKLRSVFRLKNE